MSSPDLRLAALAKLVDTKSPAVDQRLSEEFGVELSTDERIFLALNPPSHEPAHGSHHSAQEERHEPTS